MNSRNNSYRGFGFYLVLILIVVGVWYFLDGNTTTNSYTRAAFEKDIQSGDAESLDSDRKCESYILGFHTEGADRVRCK